MAPTIGQLTTIPHVRAHRCQSWASLLLFFATMYTKAAVVLHNSTMCSVSVVYCELHACPYGPSRFIFFAESTVLVCIWYSLLFFKQARPISGKTLEEHQQAACLVCSRQPDDHLKNCSRFKISNEDVTGHNTSSRTHALSLSLERAV